MKLIPRLRRSPFHSHLHVTFQNKPLPKDPSPQLRRARRASRNWLLIFPNRTPDASSMVCSNSMARFIWYTENILIKTNWWPGLDNPIPIPFLPPRGLIHIPKQLLLFLTPVSSLPSMGIHPSPPFLFPGSFHLHYVVPHLLLFWGRRREKKEEQYEKEKKRKRAHHHLRDEFHLLRHNGWGPPSCVGS